MDSDNVKGIICPFMSRMVKLESPATGYQLITIICWESKCGAWSPVFKCCGFSLGGLKEGRH